MPRIAVERLQRALMVMDQLAAIAAREDAVAFEEFRAAYKEVRTYLVEHIQGSAPSANGGSRKGGSPKGVKRPRLDLPRG